ncbi:MAG: SGNH/GDSL hydrolase family protein [Algoriphagus sp.]|uniref:GDSL-type esterase/lipase family protein n=1 Tax=Algoriphagus sp. TaxID=1872435 RepID=UPI0017E870D1|nr:GDSL-type esterase/lipase family protein [Algoriphagus sp.]NVJ86033.1 SGNH/GDSL hydrolase family protein [Algoriphagus sp.]
MRSYRLFQAQLFPVLPYLIFQAKQVRKNNPLPPAKSNHLILGTNTKRILILGESTAAGVGASEPENTLAGNIYRMFDQNYQVINLGKNGLRVKELIPTFQEDLSGLIGDFEGIFLFIGANDCFRLTNPKDFRNKLEYLIKQLQQDLSPKWIYLADIPPVQLFPSFPTSLQFYLEKQRGFLTGEMQKLATSNPLLIYEKIQMSLDKEFFCSDGIHPSNLGYKAIAEFAIDGIKRWSAKMKKDIF